ncbi:MAG TPA: lysylphosphatidylglycerol synthase transmembrane domain-containing protein [Terracidiphilus sp.]|nr:lysylphosphatidylglycerol synthase transmembrane domain-containing protein [Terracidiphilus sp.]
MKRNQLILGLVVLAILVGFAVWGRDRIHFDFGTFRAQLALADWKMIAVGMGCIYLAYAFRSIRWAYLLRHNKKVPLLSLLGTQVIGFTAIALIGRVADPVRPYLVAKKTGLPISNQIAVYIVERLFDFGSMALVFSIAMLGIPTAQIIKATSHSGALNHLGNAFPALAPFLARYGGLVLTFAGVLFLIAVKVSGEVVALFLERALGLISHKLGNSVAEKIRSFRSGLDAMQSKTDVLVVSSLSIGMWLLIASSYICTCRAFVASPELRSITVSNCVLLMITSGGASIIQLPVIGWFTQIGLVAAAIVNFFGASNEASTACAATLLLVTFLCVVPVGLIWAQFEHVSLRKVTEASGHLEEDLQAAGSTE